MDFVTLVYVWTYLLIGILETWNIGILIHSTALNPDF